MTEEKKPSVRESLLEAIRQTLEAADDIEPAEKAKLLDELRRAAWSREKPAEMDERQGEGVFFAWGDEVRRLGPNGSLIEGHDPFGVADIIRASEGELLDDAAQSLQEEWLRLRQAEVELRKKAGKLISEPSTSEFGQALRDWWGGVEKALAFYNRNAANWRALKPPAGLLNIVENLAGYLAAGTIPKLVARAATRGAPAAGPTERRHIAIAVAYIRAAEAHFAFLDADDAGAPKATGARAVAYGGAVYVVDPHPKKTVREAFGISAVTLRRWQTNAGPAAESGEPE
ncbi:hypothetical protein [Methylocella sp.]|uniref:hypothetical protein n=1 Tax=Methylocella sp. TaxID=1978226 RepID=UPI003782D59A